ncbi:fasciclin-like arabinogalactan protein 4 [Eucalyptus grandis]|uniref:Uncharacterized protein n=2 Tax=Eucalyptus grandis TaxID=71139 RepID=A0ACC3LUM0_EUCGR|nr:fasciclin-like arabinogalactan protein 4 [Eucalyptus grandis]KAK3442137.1 hypothetical protein EUGRSUZ_B02370 [Eucalyptus grandis]
MAERISIPKITPATLLYVLLLTLPAAPTASLNVTALLSTFPELSAFTALLSSTIASDLAQRSAVTVLAVPNAYLASSDLTRHLSQTSLADVLRYHVLLQFLSADDLHQIPSSGALFTTLFQTTGRATSNFGSVNITRDPSTGAVSVRSPAPYSPSNASLLEPIKAVPYNLSIFTVNSLLLPYGFDLMASETRPSLDLNITKALIDGHNFNVAASMLAASGVVEEFQADEGGAGITLFVPTDSAFTELPSSQSLQSLPADKKAVVLKFHVLHSYYPLGSLESIVNPLQPTLATEDMGAGSYTLNISRVNGSVAIDTGIVQATVTQTVFDENPVAIFGVSRVLLPREIFGKNPSAGSKSGGAIMTAAPPPDITPSPENSPGGFDGPPPVSREEIRSGSSVAGVQRLMLVLCCIVVYLAV